MTYAVPRVLVLTDRSALAPGRRLLEVVEAALDGGAQGILVRERDLPAAQRSRLVAAVGVRCLEHGAALVVASAAPSLPPVGVKAQLGSPRRHPEPGVHLRSGEAAPPAGKRLLGRSCHDVAELVAAARDGLDYVTISPVALTGSKPGHGPALGTQGLADVIGRARAGAGGVPPVLALGGVTASNAAEWVEAGARGVAVMGAVMRAADPAETVARMVEAVAGR